MTAVDAVSYFTKERSVHLELVGELCLKVVGVAVFVEYCAELCVNDLLVVSARLVELLPEVADKLAELRVVG